MEWIAIIIAGICLYQVYEMKKQNVSKDELDKKLKAEEISKKLIRQRLVELQGCSCEVVMKKALLQLDAVFSIFGVLENMDEDWIVMVTPKKKKQIQRIIKINDIKEVKAIVNKN